MIFSYVSQLIIALMLHACTVNAYRVLKRMSVIVQHAMVVEIVIKISVHRAIRIHATMERAKKIESVTSSVIVLWTILESFAKFTLNLIHCAIKIHALIMVLAAFRRTAPNGSAYAPRDLLATDVKQIITIAIRNRVKTMVDVLTRLEDFRVTVR